MYRDHFSSGNSTIDNHVLFDAMVDRGYDFGVFARSNFDRHKIHDTVFRGIPVGEEQDGPTDVEHDRDLTHQLIDFLQKGAVDGLPPELALRFLECTGLIESTVVVITTDHGESFDDEGVNFWGHGSSFIRYQTQFPLIVREPGRNPEVITQRTPHVDVVPTPMRSCGTMMPSRVALSA